VSTVPTKPSIHSPESDRRILDWLFRIRQARLRLGPVARPDEPHTRTLWRECLRAAEASLRCLWVVRLGLPEESDGQDADGMGDDADMITATREMASVLRDQARWQARQAFYLLNEYRRHGG